MMINHGKDWNKRILPIIKDQVDYLSCHLYLPGPGNMRNASSTSTKYAYNETSTKYAYTETKLQWMAQYSIYKHIILNNELL